jgi:hypothetical protein
MKKIAFLSVLSLCACFYSCSSDDDETKDFIPSEISKQNVLVSNLSIAGTFKFSGSCLAAWKAVLENITDREIKGQLYAEFYYNNSTVTLASNYIIIPARQTIEVYEAKGDEGFNHGDLIITAPCEAIYTENIKRYYFVESYAD